MLVDEWAHDGSWLLEPREPEAVRIFLAIGSIDEVCAGLDRFYEDLDMRIASVSRSDDPPDWCGRSVAVAGGRVSIDVEPAAPWIDVPPELAADRQLAEVAYAAHR